MPSARFNKGMTLVELLVSLGIFAVIIVAVSAFEVNVFQYRLSAQNSIISAQDAENILKSMDKDLRSTRTGAEGSYAIVSAGTSSLTFFSDANGDGTPDEIIYFVASSTLKRGIIVPTGSPAVYNPANQMNSVLVNTIVATTTPIFQYYDDSYAGTTTPLVQPVNISDIRLVQITLTIDADPRHSPIPITYTSQATLRNLKDNL